MSETVSAKTTDYRIGLKPGRRPKAQKDPPDLDKLRIDNIRLKNQQLKIGNDASLAKLVSVNDFKQVVNRIATECKVQFERLPAGFKQRFGDEASEDMITYLDEAAGEAVEAIVAAAERKGG